MSKVTKAPPLRPDEIGRCAGPVGAEAGRDVDWSASVQADGKIVVAGYGLDAGAENGFAVVRLNRDGTLDTGFGRHGVVLAPVGASFDLHHNVEIQTDGGILVTGHGRQGGTGRGPASLHFETHGRLHTGLGGTPAAN